MKKLFSTFIKAITMLSFIFSANLAFANKKVTIVVEHWAPWEIAHDDNKANITDGLAIDILNELFSRLELDIEYKNTPWQRALKQIETGEIDLIPMVLKTPEREEYMTFTTPIYNDPILFAYSTDKHDALEWNSWEDLKSLKIGMTRGYTYGGLNDAIKEGELDATVSTNDTQSIKKLLSGRFDIVPLFYSSAVSTLKEISGGEKIKFAKKTIEIAPMHFGISKKSFLIDRKSEIDKALQDMKDDGTFKKILGEFYVE